MSTTPKALELADEQETQLLEVANGERKPGKLSLELFVRGAAELRRQHGENAELRAQVDSLTTALAKCRDAFPMPDPGAELEPIWGQAMGDPESVPGYVRDQVTWMTAERRVVAKRIDAAAEAMSLAMANFDLRDQSLPFERALSGLRAVQSLQPQYAPADGATCDHAIADARNPVVKDGYFCVKCGALFRAADHEAPQPLTRPAVPPVEYESQGHIKGTSLQFSMVQGRPILDSMGEGVGSGPRPVVLGDSVADEHGHRLAIGTLLPNDYATRPAVPEGWKLVPVEPYDDMLCAAQGVQTCPGLNFVDQEAAERVWQRMLAAAPQPEAAQKGGE